MFRFRDHRDGNGFRVEVAFTDATTNLQGLRERESEFARDLDAVVQSAGVAFARLSQVHGDTVLVVDGDPPVGPSDDIRQADALVTTRHDTGLMIRVADCVPVVLADPTVGVIGAVHSGRPGMALNIVTRAVESMRDQGAESISAWIGPHVCGSCYEVPEQMRAEVAAVVPAAHAETSWGTPALDIGAGVRSQLEAAGVEVIEVGGCTLEDQGLHSFRRDGANAGRFAGLVWMSSVTSPDQ